MPYWGAPAPPAPEQRRCTSGGLAGAAVSVRITLWLPTDPPVLIRPSSERNYSVLLVLV